jgi:hypothetical protein
MMNQKKKKAVKWADLPVEEQPCISPHRTNDDEARYGDFNAPLGDPRGGLMVAPDARAEADLDLYDTEEAERRLRDESDQARPFKRSC